MAALIIVLLILTLGGFLLGGLAALPLVLIVAVVGVGIWIVSRGKAPTPR